MTDIVTKLRQYAENDMRVEEVCLSAVDEIERLRQDINAYWREMELMRSDLSIYAENIDLMRELLRFYAQNDPAIGMCGYDQSYTSRGDGCLIKTWEGEVLEDAGRKAQLLLLDMFGETGAWRDEATAREVLKGVSYLIERIEVKGK